MIRLKYILLSLVCLMAPTSAWGALHVISQISIHLQSETITETEIKNWIGFKEGDQLDLKKQQIAKQARQNLEAIGLFESIHVAVLSAKKDNVIVMIDARQIRPVRKISIHGEYPLLSKKVLRLLSLQSGDPFVLSSLEDNKNRIIKALENLGYKNTSVEIEHHIDKKHQTVDLDIHIKKGKKLSWGTITLNGNHDYSNRYLIPRVRGFGKFSPYRLKKHLAKIEKHYHKKGYVRARVHTKTIEIDENNSKINVALDIQENHRLILDFEGNHLILRKNLKEIVSFYTEEGYSRYDIDKSVDRLLRYYAMKGFINASITPEIIETPKKNIIHIILHIDEGIRTRIKKISFSGLHGKILKKSRKALDLKPSALFSLQNYNQLALVDSAIHLEQFLKANGYLDVVVSEPTTQFNTFGDQAKINYPIKQANPYKLKRVIMQGNHALSSTYLLKKMNWPIRSIYKEADIQKSIDKGRSEYFTKGYPHVNITHTNQWNDKTHTVDLTINIDEGPLTFFGDIVITGNETTLNRVIYRALKFKTGDLYSYKKLMDAQLNLKRLGIFDYVRVKTYGLEEKSERVNVVIEVVERKSSTVDIQGGFDSEKLATGQVTYTKRNLFGLAKQIQLRGLTGFEINRGEFTFYSPRVFGASWNLVNQYFVEHQNKVNYNALTYGTSIGTLKYYKTYWSLLLKSEINRFDIYESQSNTTDLADNLFDTTTNENSISVGFDTRNNFANPTKGIYTLVTTEIDSDLADLYQNNINITKIQTAHYFSFFKRFTLINNLRLGRVFALSKDTNIQAQKLFFLGGNDTIRGFKEDTVDPSGGTTMVLYNVELNFTLFGDVKLAGFFDTGALSDQLSHVSIDDFRESAGVGLRYMTPIGPIRLDYGKVLDKRAGELGSRIHFSFGYYF